MITLVTGPPGTGKTWYAVRHMALVLHQGKYVVTNVKLHEGWAMQMARSSWLTRLFKGSAGIEARARSYEERVFVSGELSELFAVRIPDCGKCKACKRGRTCMTEGRAEMILDEAHEWLNARAWDQDVEGRKITREVAVALRLQVVKFFALHRKLGYHVKLITQSEKRLDNQVRDNFEYHMKLKNMKKFKVFGLFPIVPFNLFVAITHWHASGGERVGVETYLLSKLADCYDTMARPDVPESGDEVGVIRLPLSSEERAARAAGKWCPPTLRQDRVRPDGRSGEARSAPRPPGRPTPSPVPQGEDERPSWVV